MKIATLFLIMIFIACEKSNNSKRNSSIPYRKEISYLSNPYVQNYQDINQKLLRRLYNDSVLTMFLNNNIIVDEPINKIKDISKSNIKTLSNEDIEFFKFQQNNSDILNFRNFFNENKLISKSDFDSFFKDPNKGWDQFKLKYPNKCITKFSIPFFSSDYKRIYVYEESGCNYTNGSGAIIELTYDKNNKLYISGYFPLWIA